LPVFYDFDARTASGVTSCRGTTWDSALQLTGAGYRSGRNVSKSTTRPAAVRARITRPHGRGKTVTGAACGSVRGRAKRGPKTELLAQDLLASTIKARNLTTPTRQHDLLACSVKSRGIQTGAGPLEEFLRPRAHLMRFSSARLTVRRSSFIVTGSPTDIFIISRSSMPFAMHPTIERL